MFNSKSHFSVWICLLFSAMLFSQTTEIKINEQSLQPISKVALAVQTVFNSGHSIPEIKALIPITQKTQSRSKFGSKIQFLKADAASLHSLVTNAPDQVLLNIPVNSRENVRLKLIKVNILAEGFHVFTSDNEKIPVNYLPGIHYRGIVEGNENSSLASISIFENEVIGSFTYDDGNMNLQPSDLNKDELILYNDKDVSEKPPFECNSELLDKIQKPIQPRGSSSLDNCVRVYIECDFALFQNKNGTTSTVNWITSVFNNIAALYANENVNTTISEVFVWTSADSYSKTNSVDALNQFKNARPSFNGDIAHLAALGGSNLGGVAWVDVLCSSFKYAYSNISSSYSAAPAYSWTVEVMTHEMGHNLGSNHTQWCGWSGGALDNCYTTEGGCPPGPAPTNGGTIMSYCHLTSNGINFNNGFGSQPGDKIRLEVSSSSCLGQSCGGSGGTCNAPSSLSVSSITQTAATSNWATVSGALTYTFEYKTNSETNWTVNNVSSTSFNLSSLVANTLYNTRVKTNCTSGSSSYSSTINFTTGTSEGSCGIPANLNSSSITQSTATVTWTVVNGASSYNLQYKLASGSTWLQSNVTTNSVSMTGMSPGTAYNVKVQAICGSNQSAYSTAITLTTTNGYCNSKSQSTSYEWIKRVNLGTIDRISAADGGYFNATNLSTNLVKGSTVNINYQSGTTGSSGTLYWRIWIDYNNNNSFEDANEMIVSASSSSTSLLSSPITIPGGAATASVRMRVALKYGGFPTPCLTYSYGEVEDYTVNILNSGGGDICNIPAGLNFNNIGKSSATANWNTVSGITAYSFEYKKNTESNWLPLSSVTTNVNLSGLSANTLYNGRIKSICTSGGSDFSAIVNFTTESEPCDKPQSLTLSGITKTTALAVWTPVTGAVSYSFEYKTSASSNWITNTTSIASFNLSLLSAGTAYQARVKTNCSNGSSDFSTLFAFTTENESCNAPAELAVTNIESFSAKANWSQVSGVSSYNLEYKLNSSASWIVANTATNNYLLQGLTATSLYDIRVKSICTNGQSDYGVTIHFTTPPSSSCGIPANLTAANLTQSGATISWPVVPGATSYTVQYKTSAGSNWTSLTTVNALINLGSLTPATTYNVKVLAVCISGSSSYSAILNFNTTSEYCGSKGQSTTYEWIKRVVLGSIDRSSGKDGGYFNATVMNTNLSKGSTNTINYQCATSGSSGTLYWRVWIDFNNNNSFEDAGEMIVSVSSASTAILTSSFTVPSTAATASVRMRVSLKYGGFSTSCLTYSYGEVEDYTINLVNSGGLIGPGLSEEKLNSVTVYPNPFTSGFQLNFNSVKEQNVQVIIINQLGSLYFSRPLFAHEGANQFYIETGEILPASYLLQIKTEQDIYSQKIIRLE